MMPRTGMQMYTLREIAAKDYERALALTSELGFAGAQVSGSFERSAGEIARLLEKHGLEAAGTHVRMQDLVDEFDRAVADAQALGVEDVVISALPSTYRADAEGWLRAAKTMDELGARLKERGIYLGYHNHAFEFQPVPGTDRCGFDILFENVSLENVQPELDTYWLYFGGQDPVEYLRRFSGHARLVHIKDGRLGEKPVFTELGQGEIDWGQVFPACDESGSLWLLYEQDSCEVSPEESSRRTAEFLRRSGRL